MTLLCVVSGDDGGGAGLPAAPAHGLSHGAAPADAGVLDEGAEPEAQVLPDRQHPGQAAPQRRQPQGGDQQLLRVSDSTQLCPSESFRGHLHTGWRPLAFELHVGVGNRKEITLESHLICAH